MRISKRILSTILTCGLAVGLLMAGVLVKPVKVEAETADTIASSSIATGGNTVTYISIPATLHVVNASESTHGETAYIPAFNPYVVAKPLLSGDYFPYDYVSDISEFPGSDGVRWISGRFNSPASDSDQFGDDYVHSINSVSFGYCSAWFADIDPGIYRYQIYFYDDTASPSRDMFTLPNMESENNMLFLDFYVNGDGIYAVVLVDDQNRKLVKNGSVADTDYSWINSATEISTGPTIDYNVVDVTIANKIIGSNRRSPFHYILEVGDYEAGGPTNYAVSDYSSGTCTYPYESVGKFRIDEKYGDFTYTINNYPNGQTLTVTQDSPPHTATKLEIYTAEAGQYTGDITDTTTWKDTVASTLGYEVTTGDKATRTITVTSSTNAVSFVNLAIKELPPTGITTTVLPFVILIVLAGGLLTFFVRRKEVEG